MSFIPAAASETVRSHGSRHFIMAMLLTSVSADAADFDLAISPVIPGAELTIEINGATPHETIDLFRTDGGLGDGACHPTRNTSCLDILPGDSGYLRTFEVTTDAHGHAVLTIDLPESLPTGSWYWQAVTRSTVLVSHPLERPVCDVNFIQGFDGPDASHPEDSFVPDLTTVGAVANELFVGGQGEMFAWGAPAGTPVTMYIASGDGDVSCPVELGGACLDLTGDITTVPMTAADGCGVAFAVVTPDAGWADEVTLQAAWYDEDGVLVTTEPAVMSTLP